MTNDFRKIHDAVERFKKELDESGYTPTNTAAAQEIIDSLTGSGIINRDNLADALCAIENRGADRAADIAVLSETN